MADCVRRLADHREAKEATPLFPTPPADPRPGPARDPYPADLGGATALLDDLRRAQARYFRTRSTGDLAEAKVLEARADAWLRARAEQPGLPFGD